MTISRLKFNSLGGAKKTRLGCKGDTKPGRREGKCSTSFPGGNQVDGLPPVTFSAAQKPKEPQTAIRGGPGAKRQPQAAPSQRLPEAAQAAHSNRRQASPKRAQFFLHFSVRFSSLFSVSFLSWVAPIEQRLGRIKTVSNSFLSANLQPDPSHAAKEQNREK